MWAAAFDTVRFDDAIDWFKRRVPITDDAFRSSAEQSRRQAFWIAGVTQADVIKDVQESLKKALADGVPFETWKKEIGPKLSKAWLGTVANEGARTELIFRNWAQSSYSRARWDQMNEPSVKRFRPYAMFDGVKDSRQSEICKACNGTLLPLDHPWWATHKPPLHHACRSGIRSLTRARAEERGITKKPTAIGASEGFGTGEEYKGPKRLPAGIKPERRPRDVPKPKQPAPPPPPPIQEEWPQEWPEEKPKFIFAPAAPEPPRTPPPAPVATPAVTTPAPQLPTVRVTPGTPLQDAEIEQAATQFKARAAQMKDFAAAHADTDVVKKYTASAYSSMNEALYDPAAAARRHGAAGLEKLLDQNKRMQGFLKDAQRAGLAIEGVVYRGVNAWPGLKEAIASGEVGLTSFSSCTVDQSVGKMFSGKEPVLFRIRTKSAVPVSALSKHSIDAEAILPAGVRLRVLAKREWEPYPGTKGIMVDVEEIE